MISSKKSSTDCSSCAPSTPAPEAEDVVLSRGSEDPETGAVDAPVAVVVVVAAAPSSESRNWRTSSSFDVIC